MEEISKEDELNNKYEENIETLVELLRAGSIAKEFYMQKVNELRDQLDYDLLQLEIHNKPKT